MTIRLEEFASLDALPADAAGLFAAAPDLFGSRAWWRTVLAFGMSERTRPCFLLVRADDRPAALFPLCRPESGGALAGLTTPYTCEYVPLLAPGLGVAAQAEIFAAFGRYCRGWATTRFDALPDDWPALTACETGARAAGLAVVRFAHFGNWYEDVRGLDWSGYLARRPGALRETIRRKLRRGDRRADASFTLVTGAPEPAPDIATFANEPNLERRTTASGHQPIPQPGTAAFGHGSMPGPGSAAFEDTSKPEPGIAASGLSARLEHGSAASGHAPGLEHGIAPSGHAARLEHGIAVSGHAPGLEHGIAAFEQVYARSWKEPEPFPLFNAGLMREAAAAGLLRLGIWSIGGTPVAAQLWIVEHGTATVLKLAHDEAFQADSPGTVLTALMLRRLLDDEHVAAIDFGRGDDAYKQGWASQRRQRIGLVLVNPRRLAGLGFLARHRLGQVRKTWRGLR